MAGPIFPTSPVPLVRRLESFRDAVDAFSSVRDLNVLLALVPSAVRGVFARDLHAQVITETPTHHQTHFDWRYPSDHSEMAKLYARAKASQWDADLHLDWSIDVDPERLDVAIVPDDFFHFEAAEELGVKLDARERARFRTAFVSWMVSQFLHGEQGALYAAAQVVESVPFFDGKKYGATQVVDEARHVEAFSRYLQTKLGRIYPVKKNLFVVIEALCSDGRWDV
jgi:hypothetical protein